MGRLQKHTEPRRTDTKTDCPAGHSADRLARSLASGPLMSDMEPGPSRLVLDALGVAVYTTDAAGCMTYYNDAAADLWGWRPPLRDQMWCGSWRIYAPDGQFMPHDTCPMAICLKEARPVRGLWAYAERPDGKRVPFAPFPSPLLSNDGRLMGAVNVLVDISGLRAAESRLGTVLDAVPECVEVVGPDGALLNVNGAGRRMIGALKDQQLEGIPAVVLVAEADRPAWLKKHSAVCRGEAVVWEHGRVGLDGAAIRVETNAVPIALSDGSTGYLAISRDVTARRAAEAQLRTLQASVTRASRVTAVGAMAAGLAHELNQPLSAVSNYASAARLMMRPALECGGLSFDVAKRVSDVVSKAATHAVRAGDIVRRLRALVGGAEVVRTTLQPSALIEGAIAQALPMHIAHGGEMTFDLDGVVAPDTQAVYGDCAQLQLVLANLIRNAAEAVQDSASHRVTVRAEMARDGDAVEFSVSDTGSGLLPGDADRLFEPFLSTKPTGMGIGLTICKTIIEAQGGRIWADAARRDAGASFRFTVPTAAGALRSVMHVPGPCYDLPADLPRA